MTGCRSQRVQGRSSRRSIEQRLQQLTHDAIIRSSFTTLAGLVDGLGRERFAPGPTGPLTPTGISPARDSTSRLSDLFQVFERPNALCGLGSSLVSGASASPISALSGKQFGCETSGYVEGQRAISCSIRAATRPASVSTSVRS